jgi:phosphonate transport system substrate-binding protein
MKPRWWLLVPLFSVVWCLSLGGCNSKDTNGSTPAVLHYALSPEAEQMQRVLLHTDELRDYLQQQLHIPVEIVRVESYAATIEAMRAEKVDIANFGALGYVLASQKAGAQAVAARGDADGALGGYRAVIAVPKDSPIHSMQELKAHARDIVFSFSDPASTSGNLYPRAGLLAMGIDPEKDFKKVVFSGTHLDTIMAVKSNKVDAGAFMEGYVSMLAQVHKMDPNDVRVLWTSDLIPSSPVAVRKGLPEQVKKNIQAALVDMPTRDPKLFAELSATYRTFSTGSKDVPVNDATYDGLRSYMNKVKDFKFVEK